MAHKLVIGAVVIAVAAFAGGAYAASQSNPNPQQAFLNDVAKRLNVTPAQLEAAVKGALIDRLNAAVKAGKLTQAQANRLEQRIQQSGNLPFFFRGRALSGRLLGGPGRLPGGGPGFGLGLRFGGAVRAATSYLGLTPAQLKSDLAAGKSLAQIAQSQGKSVSGLEQTLTARLKSSLDKAVAAGRFPAAQEQRLLSQFSSMIDRLVNRAGLAGTIRLHGSIRVPGGWGAPPPNGGSGVPPALFATPAGQPQAPA